MSLKSGRLFAMTKLLGKFLKMPDFCLVKATCYLNSLFKVKNSLWLSAIKRILDKSVLNNIGNEFRHGAVAERGKKSSLGQEIQMWQEKIVNSPLLDLHVEFKTT